MKMTEQEQKAREKRRARWWMGGVAAAGATCFTQSLDTIKVQQQTQQHFKLSMLQLMQRIIREEGILGLNRGLTAAIFRQLTYTTFRFAFYEGVKYHYVQPGETMPFYQKVLIAAIGGTIGGYIGTPAEVINVRMQNDITLPPQKRRNYKNVLDGLIRIYKEEGFKNLFSGSTTAVLRSAVVTVGQLSFYDQTKTTLILFGHSDKIMTHFLASTIAGCLATVISHPVDVIKTRVMKAQPGEYKNTWHVITQIAKLGPTGFYSGFILRLVRVAPHTILTFIFFEQLRLKFGIVT